ncbi:MAG: MerR family DNA-binding protein [Candidatus Hydrogenedentota bacterium]
MSGQGLLEPAGRSEGNYRLYGEESLERLRFIRAAQDAGFTLQDVTGLLDLRDGKSAPCAEVRGLVEARLLQLETRLRELREAKRTLEGLVKVCREAADPEHCRVIEQLDGRRR